MGDEAAQGQGTRHRCHGRFGGDDPGLGRQRGGVASCRLPDGSAECRGSQGAGQRAEVPPTSREQRPNPRFEEDMQFESIAGPPRYNRVAQGPVRYVRVAADNGVVIGYVWANDEGEAAGWVTPPGLGARDQCRRRMASEAAGREGARDRPHRPARGADPGHEQHPGNAASCPARRLNPRLSMNSRNWRPGADHPHRDQCRSAAE